MRLIRYNCKIVSAHRLLTSRDFFPDADHHFQLDGEAEGTSAPRAARRHLLEFIALGQLSHVSAFTLAQFRDEGRQIRRGSAGRNLSEANRSPSSAPSGTLNRAGG